MVGQYPWTSPSSLTLPLMFAKPLGALRASSRSLTASPRIALRPCTARRALSTSLPALAAQPQPIKTVFDIHTVEDLRNMSAEEALHEHGRTNSSLKHFTGPFLSEFSLIPRITTRANFTIFPPYSQLRVGFDSLLTLQDISNTSMTNLVLSILQPTVCCVSS
jgi:hypothetical protein